MLDLGRVITAMVSPFHANGDVNYTEAIRLAHHLLENGSDAIILAGTTGESPTLSHDEEYQLFKQVKASVGTKGIIMAGTGSNCTKTALKSTVKAHDAGVDACLQVVPYYNKPSQEGMYQHFSTVAKHSAIPIMLYNIPGRTAANMLPETVQRLSEFSMIQSIKEAAGSLEQVRALKAVLNKDFRIYCGDDAMTLDYLKEGAHGIVSVASHLVGGQIQEMIAQYLAGNSDAAQAIHNRFNALFDVLFITTNPSPIKAAVADLGFDVGKPRLPLIALTDEEHAQLMTVLAQLEKANA